MYLAVQVQIKALNYRKSPIVTPGPKWAIQTGVKVDTQVVRQVPSACSVSCTEPCAGEASCSAVAILKFLKFEQRGLASYFVPGLQLCSWSRPQLCSWFWLQVQDDQEKLHEGGVAG